MSYWVKQYYVQFVVILVVFVCILYNDIHIIRFKSITFYLSGDRYTVFIYRKNADLLTRRENTLNKIILSKLLLVE